MKKTLFFLQRDIFTFQKTTIFSFWRMRRRTPNVAEAP